MENKIKVVIYLSYGKMQGAMATAPNVEVVIVNEDNLKADGLSKIEIDCEWQEATEGCNYIIWT